MPVPKRIDDEIMKRRFDPNRDAVTDAVAVAGTDASADAETRTTEIRSRLPNSSINFCVDNGAAVRINDARREHGQIRAFNNRTFDMSKTVPTVVMRNEDFGRIYASFGRRHARFARIRHSQPHDSRRHDFSYNTIGEITGTDKKDEVIMLGGHLDSWHAATGATDNAIGCAIMMEAARILKTLGVKPRRTIRVALWSGEEQGLARLASLRQRTFRLV